MSESREKIVDFRLYCPMCANYEVKQDEEPCNECLTYPVNTDSRKPVKFKEKENG